MFCIRSISGFLWMEGFIFSSRAFMRKGTLYVTFFSVCSFVRSFVRSSANFGNFNSGWLGINAYTHILPRLPPDTHTTKNTPALPHSQSTPAHPHSQKHTHTPTQPKHTRTPTQPKIHPHSQNTPTQPKNTRTPT